MHLAFLDIETTGLNPRSDEILEVAYILYPENTEHVFSLPINEITASKKALEVNRYWDRLEELELIEIDRKHAIKRFNIHLKDRIIVGNNIQFDLAFIRNLYPASSEMPWHYHPVDIKAFAAGRLGIQPPWSTGDLAARLGVTITDDAHSALADARFNRDMYLKVVDSCLT